MKRSRTNTHRFGRLRLVLLLRLCNKYHLIILVRKHNLDLLLPLHEVLVVLSLILIDLGDLPLRRRGGRGRDGFRFSFGRLLEESVDSVLPFRDWVDEGFGLVLDLSDLLRDDVTEDGTKTRRGRTKTDEKGSQLSCSRPVLSFSCRP